MLPVIALVGRPNVGKSTLFNRLTGTRDALVADYPGLTRDRLYGFASIDGRRAVVIDTGGLTDSADAMQARMERQVALAVAEADAVAMLVDGSGEISSDDQRVAALLRRAGKPVVLAVNKSEGRDADAVAAAYYELGLGEPRPVSATRGENVAELARELIELCPPDTGDDAGPEVDGIRVAVVGRPNVGKSTLVNRLVGEERLLTWDEAGTTRDSIPVSFEHDGRPYVLVDTAGIRRKARVGDTIEKFSIVKALKAVEDADVVIALLDARGGVTEQDVSLIGLILERGRALVIGVNKWDGLPEADRRQVREELHRQLPFADFADTHFVSALHGSNVFDLLESARRAAAAAVRDLPTPRLTELLAQAVAAHPPPVVNGRRVKLSYAHQGGKRPPVVVIHGNQAGRLPGSYRRYLVNFFRKALRLAGTPMRLRLKTGENPFAGRRNKLTPRQERRRRRVRGRR